MVGIKMRYSKIWLYVAALVACLLIGIAWGEDYLLGGYVKSSSGSGSVMGSSGDWISPNMGVSSRGDMDPGIAGM